MASDRKGSYKAPPTVITDKLSSQEARRNKALEDQKRRRAQRVDSSRQLDLFADLNLGPSDDEAGESEVVREGVGTFASMVGQAIQPDPSTSMTISYPRSLLDPTGPESSSGKSNKKKGNKKKKKSKTEKLPKASKYADKCMYAELLEMHDPSSSAPWDRDGLPEDLESGWVAIAPVPVGKRCLAVTHQSSGMGGVVPNTSLHTRLLGKSLLPAFPSPLPPQTVLDCILDPDWKTNGLVHVLDVVQWKGQDVGDCESSFRFWWRDTRLAELPRSLPPSNQNQNMGTSGIPTAFSSNKLSRTPSSTPTVLPNLPTSHSGYAFPYPTTFLPIPYHTNTSLPILSSQIIPLARSHRVVSVSIPLPLSEELATTMDVDSALPPLHQLTPLSVSLQSDGLLLYLSQASYEPGTSPLSSWIPIVGYAEQEGRDDHVTVSPKTRSANNDRPLDLFERLVSRRLSGNGLSGAEMDMEP